MALPPSTLTGFSLASSTYKKGQDFAPHTSKTRGRYGDLRDAGVISRLSTALKSIFHAPHRQTPPWPTDVAGQVRIAEVTATRDGFRPKRLESDGLALPTKSSLKFVAQTDIAGLYRVYWQVVNTGHEATRANCLRVSFEEQPPQRGQLTRTESTLYSGSHSIECFIVRDGYLLARSEPFIVNIK